MELDRSGDEVEGMYLERVLTIVFIFHKARELFGKLTKLIQLGLSAVQVPLDHTA